MPPTIKPIRALPGGFATGCAAALRGGAVSTIDSDQLVAGLVDGRADRYEDRYAPYEYAGNPDFNYRSFRTTNVLRWEYRPGSALFVVWQQGREEVASFGDFRPGRDVGAAFNAPATNVFLVKLSRWLNF